MADFHNNTIELDSTLSERMRLNILIHESLHLGDWNLSEAKVLRLAAKVSGVLWKEGYRRK